MHPVIQFLSHMFGSGPQQTQHPNNVPGQAQAAIQGNAPAQLLNNHPVPSAGYANVPGHVQVIPDNRGAAFDAQPQGLNPIVPHILNMMNSYNHIQAAMNNHRPEAQQLQMATANSAPVQNWQQAGIQPPTRVAPNVVDTIPVRGTNLQASSGVRLQ